MPMCRIAKFANRAAAPQAGAARVPHLWLGTRHQDRCGHPWWEERSWVLLGKAADAGRLRMCPYRSTYSQTQRATSLPQTGWSQITCQACAVSSMWSSRAVALSREYHERAWALRSSAGRMGSLKDLSLAWSCWM